MRKRSWYSPFKQSEFSNTPLGKLHIDIHITEIYSCHASLSAPREVPSHTLPPLFVQLPQAMLNGELSPMLRPTSSHYHLDGAWECLHFLHARVQILVLIL